MQNSNFCVASESKAAFMAGRLLEHQQESGRDWNGMPLRKSVPHEYGEAGSENMCTQ
jgi:hypothetical protein